MTGGAVMYEAVGEKVDETVDPKRKLKFMIIIVIVLLLIGLGIGITVKVLHDRAAAATVTTAPATTASVIKNPYKINDVRGNWKCMGWLDMSRARTKNHPMILFKDQAKGALTRPQWLAAVETDYLPQYCIGIPSEQTDAEGIDAIYIAAYNNTWMFGMLAPYEPPESDKSHHYQLWQNDTMRKNSTYFFEDKRKT